MTKCIETLEVILLGTPYTLKNGEKIHFSYNKMEGIFYYLCVMKRVTREELTHLFWENEDDNVGRRNLREALYQLKKTLGEQYFTTEGRKIVALNKDCMPYIDWDEVSDKNILEQERKGFMQYFFIKDCNAFDSWLLEMRNQYQKCYTESVWAHLKRADMEEDLWEVQKYSEILIRLDPYNEKIYGELMRFYASAKRYNMAIKLYHDLEKVLKDELGVEPEESIQTLFKKIYWIKKSQKTTDSSQEVFFYGRKTELLELNRSIALFSKGKEIPVIFIRGDVGEGKSRLMQQGIQMAECRGIVAVSAGCYPEQTAFFLRIWRDIMHNLLEKHAVCRCEEAAQQVQQILRLLSENNQIAEMFTVRRLSETILGIFRTLLKEKRILLFIDDLHWMDPLSVKLLNRLLTAEGMEGLSLIGTYRKQYDYEITRSFDPLYLKNRIEALDVVPFTQYESNEFVRQRLPQVDLSEDEFKAIYRRTEGNAFFIAELTTLIAEKGYTLEMSEKMVNVINERLESLEEDERRVLEVLSVFLKRERIESLEMLLPGRRIDLLKKLEILEKRGFIYEVLEGWDVFYAFVHQNFKDYIYNTLDKERVRSYHHFLAEYNEKQWLKSRAWKILPYVIYHYERAGCRLPAYRYKVQYFNTFHTIFHESFPTLHHNFDDYGNETTTSLDLLKLAREIVAWKDDSEEAAALKMEMHYMVGRYGIATGDYTMGTEHIQKSIRLAEHFKDPDCLLNNYLQMVYYGIQTESTERMRKYLKKIKPLVIADKTAYQYGIYLRLSGLCCLYNRHFNEAEARIWKAIAIFEADSKGSTKHVLNIGACYNYLGNMEKLQKNYKGAHDYYLKAIRVSENSVMSNGIAQFHSNAGQMLFHLKDFERAEEELDLALTCFYKNDYRWGIGRAEAYLALLCLVRNDRKGGAEHYEKSKMIEDKIANPSTANILRIIKAQLKALQR